MTAWLLGILTFLLMLAPAQSQQLAKRLILKDGSYQLATQWEVKGDRVRYLSSERNEWEELPYSLVDWAATDKFAQDRAAGVRDPEAVEIDKELEAERVAEEAKTPLVAPGLHLPEDGSVMLLDSFEDQPQLVELQQTAGELDKNTKANVLRAAINPIASARQSIELDGLHARIQAHTTLPAIYVNLEQDSNAAMQHDSNSATQPEKPQQPEQPQQPWDRFHIVRVQLKKDKRVVGNVKISPLRKVSQEQNLVPTTSQQLTGGWVKVTPTAALDSGEYAVVELLGKDGMNAYVWDFGVNPSAPANAGALKPATTTPPPDKTKDLKTQRQ